MQQLFSPCTRLPAIVESQGHLDRLLKFLGFREIFRELNLDVSTEELLSAETAFTYADLYAILGNRNTVAWLTPHAAVAQHGRVVNSWGDIDQSRQFCFDVDGKVIYALALSLEHFSEICDVVLRLLLAADGSEVYELELSHVLDFDEVCINATCTSLASLIEQCQRLKVLRSDGMFLEENLCLVLGTFSRPNLEIELLRCNLTNAGTSALAEVWTPSGTDQA
jgi:hypothetical protein